MQVRSWRISNMIVNWFPPVNSTPPSPPVNCTWSSCKSTYRNNCWSKVVIIFAQNTCTQFHALLYFNFAHYRSPLGHTSVLLVLSVQLSCFQFCCFLWCASEVILFASLIVLEGQFTLCPWNDSAYQVFWPRLLPPVGGYPCPVDQAWWIEDFSEAVLCTLQVWFMFPLMGS